MKPEIQKALNGCRKAFAEVPNAIDAWCCHHEGLAEMIQSPAEARIQYILANKPEKEHVTRFNNFRPVRDEAKFSVALEAYDKACASACEAYSNAHALALKAYNKACASAREAHKKARAPALEAYNKACASAWEAYDKAWASAWKGSDLENLYRREVPLGTWNGRSIFSMSMIPKALQTRRGRQLVRWIAFNDNVGDNDGIEALASYLTVQMLAQTYSVPAKEIAAEILRIRQEMP